jgi:thiol-disulfide isomerase/thioredoxin
MNRWTALVLVWLLPTVALGQSLAELARKEKERRRKNQESGAPVRVLEVNQPTTGGTASTTPAPAPAPARQAKTAPAAQSLPTAPAPAFSLEDREGRQVSLSDFRGRPVLLDFWATWCGPCRQSMPALEQIHRKYRARGLQVVGINLEGREPNVLEYLAAGGYTFPVLFDRGNWDSLVARSYGVSSIPRSFLIDSRGNIVYAGHPASLPDALLESALP